MRSVLRSLPVLGASPLEFDVANVPHSPIELFREWLVAAVRAGAVEPHVMTLSTCASDGAPDARALILKDLDDQGWWFSTSADSTKGQQLARRPAAALTFYWPSVARQVRVKGAVVAGTRQDAETDFLARRAGARAATMASRQSQPLESWAVMRAAVDQALEQVELSPHAVPANWTTYCVVAHRVEFWQADAERLHLRLQYVRTDDGWRTGQLWP